MTTTQQPQSVSTQCSKCGFLVKDIRDSEQRAVELPNGHIRLQYDHTDCIAPKMAALNAASAASRRLQ